MCDWTEGGGKGGLAGLRVSGNTDITNTSTEYKEVGSVKWESKPQIKVLQYTADEGEQLFRKVVFSSAAMNKHQVIGLLISICSQYQMVI